MYSYERRGRSCSKGYGWLLKVLSETHTKEVFNFVIKNKNEMTRTALRYAIEKMPQDLRQKQCLRFLTNLDQNLKSSTSSQFFSFKTVMPSFPIMYI